MLMLAFAITSFAQECERKEVELSDGFSGSVTLTGKTGGCNLFVVVMDGADRVKANLTSTDSKARFTLTAGEKTNPGYMTASNLTTFDKVLDVGYFLIDVKGTASTSFTLKISVTSE
ncbi:MAG: hypothetical protein HC846_06985 [Blastocatellia bacterium]|nr:hypothetical protein [Blastocatellia bacterium]